MASNHMDLNNVDFCRGLWSSFADTLDKIYTEAVFDNYQDYQKMQSAINDCRQFFAGLSDDVIKESTNQCLGLLFKNTGYYIAGISTQPSGNVQAKTAGFTGINFSRQASSQENCDCSCHDGKNNDNSSKTAVEKSDGWTFANIGSYLAEHFLSNTNRGGAGNIFKVFGSIFGNIASWLNLDDAKKAANGVIGDQRTEYDRAIEELQTQNNGGLPTGNNPNGGTPPGSSSGCKSDCDCDCHDRKPDPTKPKGDRIPGMFDPLILDLNHNGQIDTTNINSGGVYFDIDGNDGGIRERMGWVGEGDGFLVQDKNGSGKIDGIGELFGNSTTNAFDDLRTRIDSNGDGIIDSRDSLFNTLQVWIDKNGNGVTDDGELYSLSSLDITSIDTNRGYNSGSMNNGNSINSTSEFTQNGESHTAGAVDFVVDQTMTTSGGLVFISDLFLPILRGYGDVKDSVVVMHDNRELRVAV